MEHLASLTYYLVESCESEAGSNLMLQDKNETLREVSTLAQAPTASLNDKACWKLRRLSPRPNTPRGKIFQGFLKCPPPTGKFLALNRDQQGQSLKKVKNRV